MSVARVPQPVPPEKVVFSIVAAAGGKMRREKLGGGFPGEKGDFRNH
jgi:hypothetical protein